MKKLISNELYLSLLITCLLMIPMSGIAIVLILTEYPLANPKNGIIRKLVGKKERGAAVYGTVSRMTYSKYGSVGTIYLLLSEALYWLLLISYITFIIFRIAGFPIAYKGKTTTVGINDIIFLFLFVFVGQLPFKLYFQYLDNRS